MIRIIFLAAMLVMAGPAIQPKYASLAPLAGKAARISARPAPTPNIRAYDDEGPAGGFYLSAFPYSITSADFDGDGNPDIAVANLASDTITIFMGEGGGKFYKGQVLHTHSGPVSVVAEDFGGKGNIDLAVACWFDNVVDIFSGDGRGGFSDLPVKIYVGASPSCIKSADLNGDSLPDLVVSDFNDDNVAVLINGGGSFSSPIYLGTGRQPSGLLLGDFNGDGKQDIAVACARDEMVRVFFGVGNGSFREGGDLMAAGKPAFLAAADFNGDGKLDLAVGFHDSNKITVYPGAGDGMFENPVELFTEQDPRFISAGDYDGDGKPDIAYASVYGGALSVLNGNGDFSFNEGEAVPAGTSPRGFAALNFKNQSVFFAVAASSDSSVNVFSETQEDKNLAGLEFKAGYLTGQANPPDEEEQARLVKLYMGLGLLPDSGQEEAVEVKHYEPPDQIRESDEAAQRLYGGYPPGTIPDTRDRSFDDVKRELFPNFMY